MKILSAGEMQACDRATTERFGVPSLDLMRAAAAAVAGFAREQFPRARRVTVLCGRGNNGGDGMMAARLLAGAGLDVTTLLLGEPRGSRAMRSRPGWRLPVRRRGNIHMITKAEDLERHSDALDADLILDAVVGTGFKPPLKGLALAALEWVKGQPGPILAVDLPSGWPADATEAAVEGPVFPADAVITFTAPKPAHVFGQLTRRWDQPIVVAPIGSPEEAIVSALGLDWAGSAMEMVQTPRAAGANKGNFGHVLVVGGSVGRKSGAPAMAALGALAVRGGAGDGCCSGCGAGDGGRGCAGVDDFSAGGDCGGADCGDEPDGGGVEGLTAGKTVLAIGPGLGQRAETVEICCRAAFGDQDSGGD